MNRKITTNINEEMRELIASFFNNRKKVELLLSLQKLGFPPAQSFICLNYASHSELFREYFTEISRFGTIGFYRRRSFGLLIKKQMLNEGFQNNREQSLFLHHAMTFRERQ